LIRFILHSYVFRRIIILELVFITILWTSNKIFDLIWGCTSTVPLNNLNDVYDPPLNYDNFNKVNIKLLGLDTICIEGNKRIKDPNSSKTYEFYDTLGIRLPDTTYGYTNKIFFKFENSVYPDSIFLVVSRTDSKDIFWKQIFFSTVTINNLNKFSEYPEKFRTNYTKLVDTDLLKDNDTIINQAIEFFNLNKDNFEQGDCFTNSKNFNEVCDKFALPCRILFLQGGDANYFGYNDHIGYPIHAICEVYSSKSKKWFVIDPTYGFEFKKENSLLNAVEICNKIFFGREKEIIQDSILITKRSLVGRDYFKYYENIFYTSNEVISHFKSGIYKYFYKNYNFSTYQYTNKMLPKQDGFYYIGIKSSLYLILFILNINFILFIIAVRLLQYKRVKTNPSNKN